MHGVRSTAAHLPERDRAALTAGRYGVAVMVMREMHWSWQELCAAPADLVQEIIIRIAAENDAQTMRSEREQSLRESRRRD